MHAAARPAIASRFENMTGSLNSTGANGSRVPSTGSGACSNCLSNPSLPGDLGRPDCHLQMNLSCGESTADAVVSGRFQARAWHLPDTTLALVSQRAILRTIMRIILSLSAVLLFALVPALAAQDPPAVQEPQILQPASPPP